MRPCVSQESGRRGLVAPQRAVHALGGIGGHHGRRLGVTLRQPEIAGSKDRRLPPIRCENSASSARRRRPTRTRAAVTTSTSIRPSDWQLRGEPVWPRSWLAERGGVPGGKPTSATSWPGVASRRVGSGVAGHGPYSRR
jgi:hypothetical protein